MKLCRLLFLLLAISCWPMLASAAEDLKPSDGKTREAVQKVISSQLEAFRAENYATAYTFADIGIRRVYPVQQFETMVKRGYPIIAHSTSVTFGLSFDNGDEAAIIVRVTGSKNEAESYQYLLRLDGDTWRITGVVLLKDVTTEV